MSLSKKAKKLKLSKEFLSRLIVKNHELNHFIPTNKLKKIDIELDLKSIELVKKVSKELNIDFDAVINVLLEQYIEHKKAEKA